MKNRQVVLNSVKTPDGTILTSHHRHDFVSHVDANGQTYINDGGTSYLRRSLNTIPAEDLTVYADDDFELVRISAERGSRGVNGDEPLRYIKICDMSDNHLKSVLAYGGSPWHLDIIKKEIEYRKSKYNGLDGDKNNKA